MISCSVSLMNMSLELSKILKKEHLVQDVFHTPLLRNVIHLKVAPVLLAWRVM